MADSFLLVSGIVMSHLHAVSSMQAMVHRWVESSCQQMWNWYITLFTFPHFRKL